MAFRLVVKPTLKIPSEISQIVNGKVTDPRFSTVIKIAKTLNVSLDYLAGRTDNPKGFCGEELPMDARAQRLLQCFEPLPPEGKNTVQDMVDFQLSKSGNSGAFEWVAASLQGAEVA